jgi:hypothetical protein
MAESSGSEEQTPMVLFFQLTELFLGRPPFFLSELSGFNSRLRFSHYFVSLFKIADQREQFSLWREPKRGFSCNENITSLR